MTLGSIKFTHLDWEGEGGELEEQKKNYASQTINN